MGYDFSTDLFINPAGGFFTAAQNDVFPGPLYSGATGKMMDELNLQPWPSASEMYGLISKSCAD